ncbi:MAG: hypothetical protein QME85_08590, partial [Candidatus Saccharicenans sp.]|nr:hypothetical protein [Candidatus Saccharicenans sp.]
MERWTDVYLMTAPDKAIKEGVENAAFREACASITVKIITGQRFSFKIKNPATTYSPTQLPTQY